VVAALLVANAKLKQPVLEISVSLVLEICSNSMEGRRDVYGFVLKPEGHSSYTIFIAALWLYWHN